MLLDHIVIITIHSDKGLILETSALQIFHGGNSTFINFFDETKFSFFLKCSATVSLETRNYLYKNYYY